MLVVADNGWHRRLCCTQIRTHSTIQRKQHQQQTQAVPTVSIGPHTCGHAQSKTMGASYLWDALCSVDCSIIGDNNDARHCRRRRSSLSHWCTFSSIWAENVNFGADSRATIRSVNYTVKTFALSFRAVAAGDSFISKRNRRYVGNCIWNKW